MPAPLPEDKLAALEAAIFSGRKIEAIKIYREATGVGLKESKDAVEALESELRARSPEKFTGSASKGCGTTATKAAALLVGIGVAAWLLVEHV